MKSLEENFVFRNTVTKWLHPLGYSIIWAENHPKPLEDEIHFIKGKFRLVCVKKNREEHFYFIYEFPFVHDYYALKSRKYKINSDLTEPVNYMNRIVGLMPNNIIKKSFIEKLKIIFRRTWKE